MSTGDGRAPETKAGATRGNQCLLTLSDALTLCSLDFRFNFTRVCEQEHPTNVADDDVPSVYLPAPAATEAGALNVDDKAHHGSEHVACMCVRVRMRVRVSVEGGAHG